MRQRKVKPPTITEARREALEARWATVADKAETAPGAWLVALYDDKMTTKGYGYYGAIYTSPAVAGYRTIEGLNRAWGIA